MPVTVAFHLPHTRIYSSIQYSEHHNFLKQIEFILWNKWEFFCID